MDIYQTRKANLKVLIEKWGGVTSLAKRLGHGNPSFLSQLTGPKSNRAISERTARKIESSLDLKLGWLDADHKNAATTQETDQTDVDVTRLTECLELTTRLCDELGVRPTPAKFADLVAFAYAEDQSERQQYLTRIIRLMR